VQLEPAEQATYQEALRAIELVLADEERSAIMAAGAAMTVTDSVAYAASDVD
jgi:hypothetical protein